MIRGKQIEPLSAELLTFTAGEALPAYRVVYQALDEQIYLASASVTDQATNALYVTRGAYSAGDTASVAGVGGQITEPFATWPAGRRLYLQENGVLAPTPPPTGVVVVVAMALSQTKIQVVNQLAVVQG